MQLLILLFLIAAGASLCHSLTVKRAFDCGSSTVLTQNNGEIVSHGGFNTAHHYGKNMHCTWTIMAPAGMFVAVRAEAFDVEDSSPCTYDFLEIYDGNDTIISPSLGKFCGNFFNPVTSNGRYMTLEFTTDDDTQLNGFKLFYNFTTTRIVACHHHQFACANGNCIQPVYKCDGDDDCGDDSDEQNCPVVTGCQVGEFQCANNQCVDTTWLCDGDDDCGDGSDELITNCVGGGGAVTGVPILPGVVQGSSAACGQTIFNGTSGSIQSPNYPSNYPDNTFCRYQIFAPPGTKDMAFKFADVFSLEASVGCTLDYVKIYSDLNSFTHGPFCDSTSPGQFTIPTNHTIIEFSSDNSDSYQGFKLDWKVIA